VRVLDATLAPWPYVEVHDGEGPPALLVHGILSSRAQWLLNIPALRRVCSPVVLELWGHGRSPLPDDPSAFSPDSYVELFEAVRDRLGVERWLVVGQSLGAALTLRYALQAPDRVIAQVFTNSNSALADAGWQRRMRETAPATASKLEQGGRAAIAAMPVHPSRARFLPEPARTALLEDAATLEPAAVARAIHHTVPDSSVRAMVHQNRVPTLLVVGRRERNFAEAHHYARDQMPMIEIVEFDAGHAVNIGAADQFDGAVTGFFSRHLD